VQHKKIVEENKKIVDDDSKLFDEKKLGLERDKAELKKQLDALIDINKQCTQINSSLDKYVERVTKLEGAHKKNKGDKIKLPILINTQLLTLESIMNNVDGENPVNQLLNKLRQKTESTFLKIPNEDEFNKYKRDCQKECETFLKNEPKSLVYSLVKKIHAAFGSFKLLEICTPDYLREAKQAEKVSSFKERLNKITLEELPERLVDDLKITSPKM
jgi:hypothetical protein